MTAAKCARRSFLKQSAALAALGVGALGSSVDRLLAEEVRQVEDKSSDKRPNIIFFFTDQQRWDTLGCYGQRLPISPNLDRMAKEGVLFENAFTCQPVCGPARAVVQTGKYATEIGCFRNGIALPLDEVTMADRLSEAGYEVGYIGKWHLASDAEHKFATKPIPPERRGGYNDFWLASDVLEFTSHGYDGHLFDAAMNQVDFKGYRADALTDFALDYLRTRDRKRPFFLFISYIEPHFQNDRMHFEGPLGSKEKFKDFETPGDLVGTAGDWREEMPDYLGCCNSLDENVGRLRAEIEKLGIAKNTIIIYSSDHGCHFRTRNKEYKRCPHDSAIRVPLVVCGPGFGGGKVVRELVSLVDIAPTTLAAAGVKQPSGTRGRPLQDLVSGDAKGWPKEVFIQTSESETARAIRTDRWLYGVAAQDPSGREQVAYTEKYLYDLEKDPHERTNLVENPGYTGIRSRLAEILKRYITETGERDPQILPVK